MDKLKDFLLSLLTYIGESPFRLFAVVLLCVFGFGGWIIYSEKDAFMASYLSEKALHQINGKYEESSSLVLKNSKADLIAIFEVNTVLNTRKLVYFTTREGGQEKTLYGTDVGLLTKNYDNNNDVVGLMAGKIPCSSYLKPQSFLGFVYREKGVTYMCRISVPPDPGTFIGQISIGWAIEPEDLEEVKTVLTVASGILFKK